MLKRNQELFEEGLVSVKEAAQFLALSRSTLYELMERGALIYTKLGRARRIPKRALIQLAHANQSGGWNLAQE